MATTTLVTSGDAGWNTANDQTYTTASITPGANCALVLLMGGVQDAANTNSLFSGGSVTFHTVVSSGSGPTWTLRTNTNPPANFDSHAAVWTAVIGGSDPGSFTVTIDFPDTRAAGMFAYTIHKTTGHDTGTPFGGKIATAAQAGNGAVTATLDAAPGTDDHTIAFSVVDTDGSGTGATFGSSFGTWTETAEGGGTNDIGWNTGYRTGSTSTSVEWTDVNTGSATTFTSAQAAIVVKAAADGSANPAPSVVTATASVPTVLKPAAPVIATVNGEIGTSLGASNAIPAPSGVAAGDLLVAYCTHDNTGATAITASTGWTQLFADVAGSNVVKHACFARVADGGGNDALSLSGTTQDYCADIYRITGHGVHATTIATDIKIGTPANNTSGNADPPSLNAGRVETWLWLASCGVDFTTGNTISADPSGYTNVSNRTSASSTSSCGQRVARTAGFLSTQDPGAFTNSSQEWVAGTIAIPPQPVIDAAVTTATVSVPAPTVETPAGSDAAATPSVVTATAAVLAPTATAGSSTAATVVTATASVLAATASTGAIATPAVVTAAAAAIAPTVAVGQTVTATVVTASASVPAPNISAGSNANPSPNVVTATCSVPAPTPHTGSTATPTVVTATASVPAPTVRNGHTVTAVVKTATGSVPAPSVATIDFAYPASISGKKVLDQSGNVFLMKTFSSWKLANKLSNADITTALEGVAGNGFNGVTVWCGGIEDRASEGDQYTNQAGQSFWTGTPWASSLGPAWSSVDWIVDECARLELVLNFSFCAGFATEGCGPDWEAVTNTNMNNAGVAIATRYADAPHIVWHIMFDDTTTTGSTRGTRIQNLFAGINTTEGASTRPVRWCEVNQGATTSEQGWYAAGNFNCTINSIYEYGSNSTELFDAEYSEQSGPVGDCEPPYSGAGHYTGNEDQQMRERNYAIFIRGGCLINFGHEDFWPFGGAGLFTDGEDWDTVATDTEPVQASYAWALIDNYCKDSTWVPDGGTFVTAGLGSGDTKAASGFSSSAGLVYKPHTSSITVDLSIFNAQFPVARVRWFDPTDNTFDSVGTFATTGSQVIAHHGTNSVGQADWVLVVDEDPGSQVVSATVVTATASVPTPTVVRSATATPSVVTATAAEPAPTIHTGATATPTVVTATAAVLAATVANGHTVTATVVTAACSVVTPDVSAGGGQAITPSVVTATVSTLAASATASTSVSATAVTATGSVGSASVSVGSRITPTVVTATTSVGVAEPITRIIGHNTTVLRSASANSTLKAAGATSIVLSTEED